MKLIKVLQMALGSLLLCTMAINSQASELEIKHLEPANWWVGMRSSELQIMVHGDNVAFIK